MPISYTKCGDEVTSVASQMMKQFHRELYDVECRVTYIFACAPKDEHGRPLTAAVKLHGDPCAAIVKIIGLKERADGRADAEVVIDQDEWGRLTATERDALIDHELEHLEVKVDSETNAPLSDDLGRPKLKMRRHDHAFGWFDSIAHRHADASYEVKQAKAFADGAGQLYFGWKSPGGGVESQRATFPDAVEQTLSGGNGDIDSITMEANSQSIITIDKESAARIAANVETILDRISDRDELFNEAAEIVKKENRMSVSLIQRRLGIGYIRASKLVEQLAAAGIQYPTGKRSKEVEFVHMDGSPASVSKEWAAAQRPPMVTA